MSATPGWEDMLPLLDAPRTQKVLHCLGSFDQCCVKRFLHRSSKPEQTVFKTNNRRCWSDRRRACWSVKHSLILCIVCGLPASGQNPETWNRIAALFNV